MNNIYCIIFILNILSPSLLFFLGWVGVPSKAAHMFFEIASENLVNKMPAQTDQSFTNHTRFEDQ